MVVFQPLRNLRPGDAAAAAAAVVVVGGAVFGGAVFGGAAVVVAAFGLLAVFLDADDVFLGFAVLIGGAAAVVEFADAPPPLVGRGDHSRGDRDISHRGACRRCCNLRAPPGRRTDGRKNENAGTRQATSGGRRWRWLAVVGAGGGRRGRPLARGGDGYDVYDI